MDEIILTTIKDMLGISENDNVFDKQILVLINSTTFKYYQLDFLDEIVISETTKWQDLKLDGVLNPYINIIKTLFYYDIKLQFDPPSNANLLNSLKKNQEEYEYRLHINIGY